MGARQCSICGRLGAGRLRQSIRRGDELDEWVHAACQKAEENPPIVCAECGQPHEQPNKPFCSPACEQSSRTRWGAA